MEMEFSLSSHRSRLLLTVCQGARGQASLPLLEGPGMSEAKRIPVLGSAAAWWSPGGIQPPWWTLGAAKSVSGTEGGDTGQFKGISAKWTCDVHVFALAVLCLRDVCSSFPLSLAAISGPDLLD